jgi:hypothetical protein
LVSVLSKDYLRSVLIALKLYARCANFTCRNRSCHGLRTFLDVVFLCVLESWMHGRATGWQRVPAFLHNYVFGAARCTALESAEPGSAGRSAAEVDVGIDPRGSEVTRMNCLAKLVRLTLFNEIDGATPEAAPRHASSVATW